MTIPSFLHPFSVPSKPADEFVSIERGDGAVVWDTDGNEYVDAMASLWYANIGYGRSDMAEAIAAEVNRLGTYQAFSTWTNPRADEFADRIAVLSEHERPRIFFCSSGSEAVESALKISRVAQAIAGHPERTIVISRERAYHGVAYGGTSVSGLPANQEGFGPFVSNTVNVDPDDLSKMAAVMEEHRGEIAAVITEPVQGVGGVRPPEDGYLEGLRQLCDRHGAHLIFDEVITGFGRTGSWFASQHYGVRPDFQTFAKGATSGYIPLGGVIIGDAVRHVLESNPDFVLRHGFTYSGHPVACAAGIMNLDIMEEEGLLLRVPAIFDAFSAGFVPLRDAGRVSAVRGVGGMWAIELLPGQSEEAVISRLLASGVIARGLPGTVTFCPPLVISDEQLAFVVAAVDQAIE